MAVAQANVSENGTGWHSIMYGEIQQAMQKEKNWHAAGSLSYLSSDDRVVWGDQHGQSFWKQN